MQSPPSLAFVVNNAAFFVSHRLPLALHAKRLGWPVMLVTGQANIEAEEQEARELLRQHGIVHHRLDFRAGGMHPLKEARGLAQMVRLLKSQRPTIVHAVTPKGLMYGGIASRLAGVPNVVFAVSGLGFAYTRGSGLVRTVAAGVARLMARAAFAHPRKRVIVQNLDDAEQLRQEQLVTDTELLLIPGSGVDLDRFVHAPLEAKEPLVLLPARMLRDKGVGEFVEAARELRQRHPAWRFVLAGGADHDNPTAITRAELEAWSREGHVDWVGHVDITPWMARASIVCLPSYYREGMPKALLEAAAAACAVVTCDSVGCREAIKPGETGDLVPVRNVPSLVRSLDALMTDGARRSGYGAAGRRLAIDRFGIDGVVRTTFDLYERLLALGPRAR